MAQVETPTAETIRLESFGRRLRLARLDRGVSQNEIGRQLGLHGTQVSLMERGMRDPSLTELDRLAQILGRPVAWLLATDDPFGESSVSDPLLNGPFQGLEESAKISSVRFSRVTSSGHELKLVG